MSDQQASSRRRVWLWMALGLAVLLVAAVACYAVVAAGLVGSNDERTEAGKSGEGAGSTDSGQERRAPAPEPSDPARPPVLAAPEAKRSATTAGITRALRGLVGAKELGRRVGIAVRDADSGELLYQRGGDSALIPASTTKLVTATTALAELGPDHRFATSVIRLPGGGSGGTGDSGSSDGEGETDGSDGSGSDGATGGPGGADSTEKPGDGSTGPDSGNQAAPPELVLVGGGDPMLATEQAKREATGTTVASADYPMRATVDDLARRTAAGLKQAGATTVRLGFDDSRFGAATTSHWEDQYVPTGVAAPVAALWVDQARTNWPWQSPRAKDPAAHAAETFATALGRHGVTVDGEPSRRRAPDSAENVAKVHSAPLSEIVEHVLVTSDNDAAEVLAREVAIARGQPATFAGAEKAMRQSAADLGVPMRGRLYDGSGLSRDNRLSPAFLSELLRLAGSGDHPDLHAVLTGLPVAGFDGTLADRYLYDAEPGRGHVRGKTGTLTGVSTLSGVVTTKDGQVLTYAVLANGVTGDAQTSVDRITAALAECGCAGR